MGLTLEETRDLTGALMGLNPDLSLDLFITGVVQRAHDEMHRDEVITDDQANTLRDRRQALADMAAETFHAWQDMDAASTRDSAETQHMTDALARLRGVSVAALVAR